LTLGEGVGASEGVQLGMDEGSLEGCKSDYYNVWVSEQVDVIPSKKQMKRTLLLGFDEGSRDGRLEGSLDGYSDEQYNVSERTSRQCLIINV
jgi:hypothetical protein